MCSRRACDESKGNEKRGGALTSRGHAQDPLRRPVAGSELSLGGRVRVPGAHPQVPPVDNGWIERLFSLFVGYLSLSQAHTHTNTHIHTCVCVLYNQLWQLFVGCAINNHCGPK